jgi:pyruvate-formate lyase-activating enzyme
MNELWIIIEIEFESPEPLTPKHEKELISEFQNIVARLDLKQLSDEKYQKLLNTMYTNTLRDTLENLEKLKRHFLEDQQPS